MKCKYIYFVADGSVLCEEVCHVATGSLGALPVSSAQNSKVWTPPISQGNEYNFSKMPHSYHFHKCQRKTRQNEIFPPREERNEKIQCYFPGKYLEISHLF